MCIDAELIIEYGFAGFLQCRSFVVGMYWECTHFFATRRRVYSNSRSIYQ